MKRIWTLLLAALMAGSLLTGCTHTADEPQSADHINSGVVWTGVISYIDGTTVTITLGERAEGPDGHTVMTLGTEMEVFTLTEACRVYRIEDGHETEIAQRELAVGDAAAVQFGDNGAVARIEIDPAWLSETAVNQRFLFYPIALTNAKLRGRMHHDKIRERTAIQAG